MLSTLPMSPDKSSRPCVGNRTAFLVPGITLRSPTLFPQCLQSTIFYIMQNFLFVLIRTKGGESDGTGVHFIKIFPSSLGCVRRLGETPRPTRSELYLYEAQNISAVLRPRGSDMEGGHFRRRFPLRPPPLASPR